MEDGDLLIGFFDQATPIFNSAIQMTYVYKVKYILAECPFAFGVINLELYIRYAALADLAQNL